MAPVQSGKSLISEVSIVYFRANDPGPVLWLFQDDDIAKQYAETRGMKLLKSIKEVREQLPADKSMNRKQEIIFQDGHQLVIWGPSLGNLQTFGYRFVICDELWRWDPGILKEAKGRLSAWTKLSLDKLIAISQGGAEDDDWDCQWKTGEPRLWHIRCQSCGHAMYPHMTAFRQDGTRWGIMFDAEKRTGGGYDYERAATSVRFECEKCGHAHTNNPQTRAKWNLSGEYRTIGDASRSHKSYRWPAWIDSDWGPLVVEFLQAKEKMGRGSFADLILFVQKRLAEPKSEKTVHEGSMTFARAEITDGKWECEVARFVTVDRQSEDVYWLTVRQWAKDSGQSRRLVFKRCYSEADIKAVVDEVKPTRLQINIGGQAVNILGVFVDSGYRPKGDQGVYAMCARNGWAALKGRDEAFFFHSVNKKVLEGGKWVIKSERIQRPYAPWTWGDPGEGTAEQGRKHAPLLGFSSDSMADRMQEMIDRGNWIEPEGDTDTEMGREYGRQMSSEYKKPKHDKFSGKTELKWVCPSGNNHARDCGKMQTVAATMAQLL
jgi:hypothetical protein